MAAKVIPIQSRSTSVTLGQPCRRIVAEKIMVWRGLLLPTYRKIEFCPQRIRSVLPPTLDTWAVKEAGQQIVRRSGMRRSYIRDLQSMVASEVVPDSADLLKYSHFRDIHEAYRDLLPELRTDDRH